MGWRIATVGDAVLEPVHIQWDHSEYSLVRVQLTRAWYGPWSVLGANFYAWARSPTWPRAAQALDALLAQLTKEVVLSRTGPRYIMGDFNAHDIHSISAIDIWKSHGWVEIQDWAWTHHHRPHTHTSRGDNAVDYVFVSPELLPLLREVNSWPLFADHAAVGVALDVPLQPQVQWAWPLPPHIPYDQVNWQAWQQVEPDHAPVPTHPEAVDPAFINFWKNYEASLTGHIHTPERELPGPCRGRGQRVRPLQRLEMAPILRPSRPGEISQSTQLLGRAVPFKIIFSATTTSITSSCSSSRSYAPRCPALSH